MKKWKRMSLECPPAAAVTSRAAILVAISERAVLRRVPMALQYTLTGSTSCQTFPSLFS